MSEEHDYRLIKVSAEQVAMIAAVAVTLKPVIAEPLLKICDQWDKAPVDYWEEIADEFQRHRCKDANCFTETVLMRLGALSFGNPNSPFGV